MDYNRLFKFDDPITTNQIIALGRIASVPYAVAGFDDDLPAGVYYVGSVEFCRSIEEAECYEKAFSRSGHSIIIQII